MKYINIYGKLGVAYADFTSARATGNTPSGTAVEFTEADRVAYGIEVQFKAIPRMRFLQFARVQEDLTQTPGSKIQVMLYDNLDKASQLVEGTPMASQSMNGSLKEVTVAEHGKSVKVSELRLRTSFTDLMADATELLSRNFAEYMDIYLRDKAVSNSQKIISRKDSSMARPADTSGISNATARDYRASVCALDDACEILATGNSPMFNGDHYVGIFHPHQIRDLRDDSNWEKWHIYTDSEAKYDGEVGRINAVRFIETTVMPQGKSVDPISYDATLKSTHADQVPLYKGVVFSEDYYALAIALYPELRDNGVEDHGRMHSLAWYGIFGADLLYAERGVVIITT